MDINLQKEILFNTPVGVVLNYLLQNPDSENTDAEISREIKKVKKSAINIALRKLSDVNFITRTKRGRMVFNKLNRSPLIRQLKIVSNLISIQPFVDKTTSRCSKIILFGSRASGNHDSKSDFDLFVVATDSNQDLIRKILTDNLQVIFKTPEQMLTINKHEPALTTEIKKGIVLWEQI